MHVWIKNGNKFFYRETGLHYNTFRLYDPGANTKSGFESGLNKFNLELNGGKVFPLAK